MTFLSFLLNTPEKPRALSRHLGFHGHVESGGLWLTMHVFVLGWSLSANLVTSATAALTVVTRSCPQLSGGVLWHGGDGRQVLAAGIHTSSRASAPRRYVHRHGAGCTFYSGLPADGIGDLSLHDAAVLDRHWDDLPERGEGLFFAARIHDRPARVSLLNDPFGMEQIYWTRHGAGHLVSNSVAVLARLLGDTSLDPEGLSTFLC